MKVIALVTALALTPTLVWAGAPDVQFKFDGADTPTIMIPPGYHLLVGGQSTIVSGADRCQLPPIPPSTRLSLIGGQPTIEDAGCVAIGPRTTQVKVDLFDAHGKHTGEIWRVGRGTGFITLTRPNGESVGYLPPSPGAGG